MSAGGLGRLLAALIAILAALPSGCAAPWGAPPDEAAVADRQTALRVRAALSEDLGLAAAPIGVEVADGIVTLSGFTATGAERDRALSAAQRVDGVRRVRDRIRVRP